MSQFLPGFFATAIIFWPVTTIEVFTFTPMLGTGSSYLAFVTGNLTSIKVPAALNAQDALDIEKRHRKKVMSSQRLLLQQVVL